MFPQPPKARWMWLLPALVILPLAFRFVRASSSEPAPRRHEVVISGMAFQPPIIEAAVGDTIVWINRDIVPHNATDSSAAPAWQTAALSQGEQGRIVVTATGELHYFCSLHPIMQAKVVVQ